MPRVRAALRRGEFASSLLGRVLTQILRPAILQPFSARGPAREGAPLPRSCPFKAPFMQPALRPGLTNCEVVCRLLEFGQQ